jgi:hypothetical protein
MHAGCELVSRTNYLAKEDQTELREQASPTEGTVGLAIGDSWALLRERAITQIAFAS